MTPPSRTSPNSRTSVSTPSPTAIRRLRRADRARRDNVHGAYGLLATIADELQIAKLPLAAAVAAASPTPQRARRHEARSPLRRRSGCSASCSFLEFLIDQIGAGPAVESWQGPLSEEHDFVFDAVHLEVKTTTSEQRRHMMNGLTQLVPLQGVPLSLLSVQLTRSTHERWSHPVTDRGAGRARSLAATSADRQMLDSVRLGRTRTPSSTRPSGPSEPQPRAYEVDDAFPAMTPDRVGPVSPELRASVGRLVQSRRHRLEPRLAARSALAGSSTSKED